MTTHLLQRGRNRPGGEREFLPGLTLAAGRVHELCGPARHMLALLVARACTGPVFWVQPGWAPGRLHGPGMRRFADPGRFTFVAARRPADILWALEEVLRAGAVPLVVGELPEPPGLVAVRRMTLAAETGAQDGTQVPIALLLTPGSGGAAGVDSRWQISPAHSPGQEGWTLARLRARQAPPHRWQVRPRGTGFALIPDT